MGDSILQDKIKYPIKAYNSMQIEQLELGIKSGINISLYENPFYDYYQMMEIRKGLEDKVNASMYADLKINYLVMREIRLGLLDDFNLMIYYKKGYTYDVLREIRRSKENHIDIVQFASDGYDSSKLREIRKAKEKNLDISFYLKNNFSGSQLREIREGLQDDIDVRQYADRCYNWMQMEQIRLGLLHDVDVSLYKNKLYTQGQMREIRLGLEEKVDVSKYASFVFTSTDMRKFRIKNINNNKEDIEQDTSYISSDSDIKLSISEDSMYAVIEINKDSDFSYTLDDIRKFLNSKGIVAGIDDEAIRKVVDGKITGKKVSIACGRYAQDGPNGYYDYKFNIEGTNEPVLLEDGSVNFRKLSNFELVKEGDIVAIYHPAGKGTRGYTVKGEIIPCKDGQEIAELKGEGFEKLDDNITYVAKLTGKIEKTDAGIDINKIYYYNGDLMNQEIDFDGDVIISGLVGSGSRVRASGNIVVQKNVESAILEADGDIIVKLGISSDNNAVISAGGSISANFFENIRAISGNKINADYILNSDVISLGEIDVSGRRGLISGGSYRALFKITASSIGNENEIKTYLEVGTQELIDQKIKGLNEKIDSLNNQIYLMQGKINLIDQSDDSEEFKKTPIYQKVYEILSKSKESVKKYTDDRERIINKTNSVSSSINVRKRIYQGCTIKIKKNVFKLNKEFSYSTFKLKDEKIRALKYQN